MAQTKCPRCWKRVPEAAQFCRRCGYALHHAVPPPVRLANADVSVRSGPPLGLIWALFVLAMMCALFFWGMFTVGAVCPIPPTVRVTTPAVDLEALVPPAVPGVDRSVAVPTYGRFRVVPPPPPRIAKPRVWPTYPSDPRPHQYRFRHPRRPPSMEPAPDVPSVP